MNHWLSMLEPPVIDLHSSAGPKLMQSTIMHSIASYLQVGTRASVVGASRFY